MSLNPLMKKQKKVTKTPIHISEEVFDLLMDLTKPAHVGINSSKEEFVSNHVKVELRDRLTKIKENGYYLERA